MVRQPDVFERLAKVNLIVLDDDPALSRLSLEVTGVQAEIPEAELLRYAASAFRHLADDRATALNAACQSRRIHLLNLPPVDFNPGVTVVHDRRRIRVRDLHPPRTERGRWLSRSMGRPSARSRSGDRPARRPRRPCDASAS